MERITVKDKTFEVSIPYSEIQSRCDEIAAQLNREFAGKRPLFVVVLNGAFLFAAEIFRRMKIECEISFIRVSSYAGTTSTGHIRNVMGLTENIEGRPVIILEDIVDSGDTAVYLIEELKKSNPSGLHFVSLLLKPAALRHPFKLDHVGFEVPNDFLLGFGLDYDGLGRNFNDIYKLSS
jgi:hypoxanthine phosphoribosyltransferase